MMGILIRTFAAFCVATVFAQLLIVGIMAAKGNLHRETLTQALALVNGIDVTGAQLEKVVEKTQEQPMPTHEEVLRKRALMSQELQLKQDALARAENSIKKQWTETQAMIADFDRRRQEFFIKVGELEKKLADTKMQQVQQTIEELAPDQAKEQLLLMLKSDRMDDVVAIIKVMSSVKRKKILGEFTDKEDADKLHQVLMQMLEGGPAMDLITKAREGSAENP
jgi:hypothetical protein